MSEINKDIEKIDNIISEIEKLYDDWKTLDPNYYGFKSTCFKFDNLIVALSMHRNNLEEEIY